MKSVVLALSLTVTVASVCTAATCEGLATLTLPNININIVESRPPGDFTPPGAKPIANVPAFCRVAGVVKPSSDSDIGFEVWLPAFHWNGKFQGIGNGGYAGAIGFAG